MKKVKLEGAGDLVAVVAQPIARAIDSVAGTNVSGCSACEERRKRLNEMLPFKTEELDSPSVSP